jgi:hypothetical protein
VGLNLRKVDRSGQLPTGRRTRIGRSPAARIGQARQFPLNGPENAASAASQPARQKDWPRSPIADFAKFRAKTIK